MTRERQDYWVVLVLMLLGSMIGVWIDRRLTLLAQHHG